jgi:hypothetical protein
VKGEGVFGLTVAHADDAEGTAIRADGLRTRESHRASPLKTFG